MNRVENERGAPGSKDFAALLRHYRVAAGLSQAALAERAGMSSQGISALERGFRRTPQRGTLALLVGALALDYEQCREFEAAAARWALLRHDGRASVTAGPWPDAPPSHLPLSLASFVGRERELDEIAALVRDHRLVTLTGSGGVGKTQTALQVATALRDAGAIWFVGLSPLSDPSLVSAAVASALRVQEVPNRSLLETLLAHLKNTTLLLVLDNCEHVVTEAATVAYTLLAGCPRVRILATSREPLRASGEHTYRLPPLRIPSRETTARLCATDAVEYGAIELFSDRARAVDHRFALSDENSPAVGELCRRLDGIPLAIELAAARVNSLSITALVERLEARFRILAGGERTALPRQQTMRAAIDWSYDLLSAPEQRVFERLSIFAGGCTLASAEAVCAGDDVVAADIANLISSLVDKSTVIAEFDGIEPRYRLLESFRQYGHEKLIGRGERQIVAHRHALACRAMVDRFVRAQANESEAAWQRLLHSGLDDWRLALKWSLTERGDVVLGQELVASLMTAWYYSPVEGRRWLAAANELLDEQTPTKLRARLKLTEADNARCLFDYEAQLASSEQAITLFRAIDEPLRTALAQGRAGQALGELGRFAESEKVLLDALAACRRLEERRAVAYILQHLAGTYAKTGDISAARRYVAESIAGFKELDQTGNAAAGTCDLANFELYVGNPESALRYAAEALAMGRPIKDTIVIVTSLVTAARGLILLARYDEATEYAREALALARKHQLEFLAVLALRQLGAIAAMRRGTASTNGRHVQARGARILGFADARLKAMLFPLYGKEQEEHDRPIGVLRDALGDKTFVKLTAEGEAMTEEQAVNEALAL
jgi:predicted ATPase/transcriptional regulator with XRE-family HTH domain